MKALLLGFAVLCSAARAQTEPDTLDYRGYFPLEVGNEWQYTYTEEGVFGGPGSIRRYRVLANPDSASGFPFLMRVDMFSAASQTTSSTPVRYNDESAAVWGRWGHGEGPFERHCHLDAPFGGEPTSSEGCPGSPGWASVARSSVLLSFPDGSASDRPSKRFQLNLVGGHDSYVHGLGYVLGEWWSHGGPPVYTEKRLTYARVGDVVFGTPLVSAEEAPAPTRAGATLRVGPNPTSRAVWVQGDADDVRVTDALGREVARGPLRTVDVSAWPSGVYHVVGFREGQVVGRARVVVSR